MPSTRVLELKAHWEDTAKAMANMPPLDEWRDTTEREWAKLTGEPGDVDYMETNAGGTSAMWIVPKGCAENRVVLCMHGGGYFSGSMYTHRKMFGHLAKAIGCRALSINYRRSPEHRFPLQLDDTIAAYRWLLDRGIESKHVALTGDSSGGGLAIGAMLRARDERLPLPAAAMTISAWLDLELSGDSYETNRATDVLFRKEMCMALVQMVLGDRGDRRNPYLSPLYADLVGLPPVFLQVGGDECLLDDSRRFAAKAAQSGVDVRLEVFPAMLHTFQMTAGRSPEADEAIRKFAEWARPMLGLGNIGQKAA